MGYVLQNRWRVRQAGDDFKLVYYGLRNWPGNRRQLLSITKEEAGLLERMYSPVMLEQEEKRLLGKFMEENIVVPESEFRPDSSSDNYRTCVRCINNDYVIPGLEFDENGMCAFCQCYDNEKPDRATSLLTIDEEELQRNIKEKRGSSRYDVMVFFTGGKDSTYLVWHLSKNLNLRVLAACWDMPFTNENSRNNARRMLSRLPDVELVQWTLSENLFREAIRKQYEAMKVFCLCPVPAYALFYPLARMHNIPYVMWGMEDVQTAVMEYIFPAEKNETMQQDAREQTLQLLRARAMPGKFMPPITWKADMHNYHVSLQRIFEPLFAPLQELIREAESDRDLDIPIIKRLKTKDSYGEWQDLVNLLRKEVGWEMPENQSNQLHTSCIIEGVKDYTQYLRFKNMESVFFPQAIVELSAAVVFGHISREQAFEHSRELGFFNPPEIYKTLLEQVQGKE